jgi:hypothetical protein
MQEEGTDLKVCMSPHGHDYTGIGNHTNVLGINPVRIYDQASWASECLTHITQQLDFFKSVQVLGRITLRIHNTKTVQSYAQ